MEHLLNSVYWVYDNYVELLSSLATILFGLQMIVRLTPTKKDDSALARVGKGLDLVMGILKVPNLRKVPGKLKPGVHKKASE